MKDYSCKLVKQSEFEHDDRKKKKNKNIWKNRNRCEVYVKRNELEFEHKWQKKKERKKIYETIETGVKFMLKETI